MSESLLRADMYLRGEMDWPTLVATSDGKSLGEYTPHELEEHLDWVREQLHLILVWQTKHTEELEKLKEQEKELESCIKKSIEGGSREVFAVCHFLKNLIEEEKKEKELLLEKISSFELKVTQFGCGVQSGCA